MKLKGSYIKNGFYLVESDVAEFEADGKSIVYIRDGYVWWMGTDVQEELGHVLSRNEIKIIKRLNLEGL
jgi:hypothetical protein